jgi:hypothetical protein
MHEYVGWLAHQVLVGVQNVVRATTDSHARLRDRLVAVILATLAIDLVGSTAMYFLERHTKGTQIKSLWLAFFWTSAQLLTVSSQMKNPVTNGGRVLDLLFELWAITAVAAMAGSFAAFFHRGDVP